MVQMDAVEEIESRRSESDVDGGEARERSEIPNGRVVPLNSRHLTAAHLKQVAEALELPTSGAADQLRQLIKGKLESKRHVDGTNVIQEEQSVESKLTLLYDSGVFLTTPTVVLSRRESESEMEALQEALTEANQQNSELSDEWANTVQKLEKE